MMKKICTFDEWLLERFNMTKAELRFRLFERLPYYNYDFEHPDTVIAVYRRKYREEMDIIASENIDYTFLEWMQVYEHHTPETFHKMCEGTGMSSREETWCMDYLMEKWKKRHEKLSMNNNPFENKED